MRAIGPIGSTDARLAAYACKMQRLLNVAGNRGVFFYYLSSFTTWSRYYRRGFFALYISYHVSARGQFGGAQVFDNVDAGSRKRR